MQSWLQVWSSERTYSRTNGQHKNLAYRTTTQALAQMLKTTQMTAAKQWIAVNILPEDCCDGMSEYESTDGLERLATMASSSMRALADGITSKMRRSCSAPSTSWKSPLLSMFLALLSPPIHAHLLGPPSLALPPPRSNATAATGTLNFSTDLALQRKMDEALAEHGLEISPAVPASELGATTFCLGLILSGPTPGCF